MQRFRIHEYEKSRFKKKGWGLHSGVPRQAFV